MTMRMRWLVLLIPLVAAGRSFAGKGEGPQVGRAAYFAVSPAVRDLNAGAPAKKAMSARESREIPRHELPKTKTRRTLQKTSARDSLVQPLSGSPSLPEPLLTFEGVGNLDGVHPSDCNGDVGLNHYVEMVNLHMCIYDKITGTNLVAPFLMSSLYAAAGFPAPASTTDDGDPVVLYDHLAHRWFISQFIVSVTPCHEVIAISKTTDPTGEWYLYDFVMPNTKMNDYPHFGVWPDGYYMTDNQFGEAPAYAWGGAGVFAFDRARMLAGDTNATYQYFDLYTANADFAGMLPADLDGPPPPEGTPCPFLMVDDSYVNSFDAMYMWEFHVDWTNPANSTFGSNGQPNYTNSVAPFDSAFDGGRNNIPQPGTSQKLDALADRLMHRVQYRYFGEHSTLVASHTVDVDTNHAGVRYYHFQSELPVGPFDLADQGTFAPDSAHRWMSSAAMDGQGNLAVGYSCSSTSIYPSIRYAGRLATDPTGGLFQGEAVLYAGAGAQTSTYARWGDYSMLSVDPVDDVTFWYVNEYLPTTSYAGWHTRVGAFRLGAAERGEVSGAVTNALTGEPIAGAMVSSSLGYATPTLSNGTFRLALPTGEVSLVASALDFQDSAAANVEVMLNVTTEQNFALSPIPMRVLPRTGWSAAGVDGGPFNPASASYVVSNASDASLVWTASVSVGWVSLSAQGGALAPGEAATVVASFNFDADFLSAGTYGGALALSNVTSGATQSRSIALVIEPRLETIACEDFSGGIPGDWEIRTNGSQLASAAWRAAFSDNRTGGTGGYALVDDDEHGTFVLTDTELITAPLDLVGLTSPVLQFKTRFVFYEAEVASVDISTAGPDGPWDNIWEKTQTYAGAESVSLDAWEDQTNIQFRFHYNDNGAWGYVWQVDDVCVKGVAVSSSGGLTVKPDAGWFASGYAGGPFAPQRLYRLENESGDSLEWALTTDCGWLTDPARSGALAVGASTDLLFSISGVATSYAPGVYESEAIFTNITEGLAQSRALSLVVWEPLSVAPSTPWLASGLEGGPFTPGTRVYVISNRSENPMPVALSHQQSWLNLSSTGGTLAAGASWSVTGALSAAALTVPGVYADTIAISNQFSGSLLALAVTVTVVEIRGDIAVYDSVAPTNDLQLPFGAVTPYTAATGSVLVVNNDPPGGRNLTIERVFLGYMDEDFSDGFAQGWREDVDANWNVVGGKYVAQAPGEDFLTAVYTNSVARSDYSFSASCSRTGETGWAQGIALRASDDFDADGVGTAYAFVVDGVDAYGVFWLDGATSGELQGWSPTTALKTNQANVLTATAEGTNLYFFINNTLVWSGGDSRFSAGRPALFGYDDATSQPEYHFAAARMQPPQKPLAALGRKQLFLNSLALPESRPEGTRRATPAATIPDDPAGFVEPSSPEEPAPVFQFANTPPVPLELAPGESLQFDVIYTPGSLSTNRNVATVQSDDNDTPFAEVALSGHAAQGLITGLVTSAYSGLGLAGALIVANDGVSNGTATTTASGSYRIPVFAGVHAVSATLAAYTTGHVSGVVVAEGGIGTANFVLTGSELTYAPTAMVVTLNYGQSQTNLIWLTNSGPLGINVALSARVLAGNAPYRIPAFTGSVPSSPESPSSQRAENRSKPVEGEWPTQSAPTRRLCYGVDMNADMLVSFYTDSPGTLTAIGSVGANLIPSVDFLNYDFTKLYALDYIAKQLVIFSVADAAKTVVGSAAPGAGESWTGIAGSPDGKLYATATDGVHSYLYTLNPSTGAATKIGETTGAPVLIDVTCDASGQLFGLDVGNDNLVRINSSTAAATVIGPIGFDANYAQGMDYDEADNVLYLAAYNNSIGAGELRIADTTTGNTTLIGAFQGGAEMCMAVVSDPAVSWLRLATSSIPLTAGGSATTPVEIDTLGVPNVASTNNARIIFSGNFVNAAPDMPVTLIILPDALAVSPVAQVGISGPPGGLFSPGWIAYTLTNQGVGAVTWSISNSVEWLRLSSASGILADGQSTSVLDSVTVAAHTLSAGVYTARLSVVNHASGLAQSREIKLSVAEPGADYFTELFSGANDLAYRTITFTPSTAISGYDVCAASSVTNFPTDPSGGTALTLGDDAYVAINLPAGKEVSLYGVAYTNLFAASNGYLTFTEGDAEYQESLDNHFRLPRVSLLFDDLDPTAGGTISWKSLYDHVAVTWQNIREYGSSNPNSFQAELFADGRIRLTWLELSAVDGLAGISEGNGRPADFVPSNLSGYIACGGFVDTDGDGMSDAWELENGLFVGLNDAQENPDSDTWPNWEEFIADSNPFVSNDPLRVQIGFFTNGFRVHAGPATTNSRLYDVEASSNLLQSSWSPLQTNLQGAASGGLIDAALTNSSAGQSLRVKIHLP